jgi:osmoprotectant transport system substrate-binding protein
VRERAAHRRPALRRPVREDADVIARRLPPLLALLLLIAALAACGGSGGSSATGRSAAGQPGAGRPPVTIGTKSSPVSLLLGQLYAQALRTRGWDVALQQDVGVTRRALAALKGGRIDVFPTSIDSLDDALGAPTARMRSAAQALAAGRRLAVAHGLALLAPARFTQAAALAVRPDYAARHRLRTIADLAGAGAVRLGATPAFLTQPGGLPGLRRAYGLTRLRYFPLTTPTQYQVLDAGKLDVAVVATTDGQLTAKPYTLLRDPRHLFGFQQLVPIAAARVLAAEGPAFARTLDAVSAQLTPRAIQQLDDAVVSGNRSPERVARDFLRDHGLT